MNTQIDDHKILTFVQDPFAQPTAEQMDDIAQAVKDQIGLATVPEHELMAAPPANWFVKAKSCAGWRETGFHGHKSNANIVACFNHTSYHTHSDQTPWCAAFVSAMLEETGHKSAHSASAWDYIRFGKPSALVPGAIVVFRWAGGGGHVTFCDHVVDAHHVACFGGNQGNDSKLSTFPRSAIVAIRWPA